jgi:two-component system sensor histidine kinase/response regulator
MKPSLFTILVIDDNISILQYIAKLLMDEGYLVSTCSNGKEALTKTQTQAFNLILLDINLPQMDGFEICRNIKSGNLNQETPIIFITGSTNIESINNAFAVGAIDYITKPFANEELSKRVCTHISLQEKKKLIQQQNQKLEELNHIKDSFFQIIAKDLKHPMQKILDHVKHLKTNIRREDIVKKNLHALLKCSRKGSGTLDNLLIWSQLQREKLVFDPKMIPLKETVDQMLYQYVLDASYKEIFLLNEIPENLKTFTDPTILATILRNIISNAVKYCREQGQITISAKAIKQSTLLTVRDTGHGIDPAVQKDIFELPLHRNHYKPSENCCGIGLFLCKRLMEKQGSTIKILSKKDEGTSIMLLFNRYNINTVQNQTLTQITC